MTLQTVQQPRSIDEAYERCLAIVQEIPAEDERPISDNEACTRLRVIDPILVDVLGWSRKYITPELPAGGGRLDYLLRDSSSVCWFVIEAKKRSSPLVKRDTAHGGYKFKLSGPVFQEEVWPIIDKQMAEYLGRYMPCFGAVTNGEQWVGFLGSLRPAGVDLADTQAVVFRSPKDVLENFERFYDCFSFEATLQRRLHRLLAPETSRGVIHCPSPQRVVHPSMEKPLGYQDADEFYQDLRRAMEAAFSPIQQDPDALAKCFVESTESAEADSRLERLASELGNALWEAQFDYQDQVNTEVAAASDPKREAPDPRKLEGQGYLARLLGEPSAGKTVFLKRFYDSKLGELRKRIALMWIDCEKFRPFTAMTASLEAMDQLKLELFGEQGPEWTHLREVYAREWQSLLRLMAADGDGTPALRQTFVAERTKEETEHPQQALRRYTEFAIKNRRRLPCFVVDNINDPTQAVDAVGWAIATHLTTFSLTTLSMDDTTLWRLKGTDQDQLAKHSPEQFWLYRPKVGDVLQNRCNYLKTVLSSATGQGQTASTRLGRYRQWNWKVNADELARVVSAVLLDRQEVAQWIGQICNYNIQEVLELCKQIVLSPHVKATDLLSTQVTRRSFHLRSVLKAIITPKNEQFQSSPTDLVMNIFGYWVSHDWSPLLPARLLAFLRAQEDNERNHKEQFPGFVATAKLRASFDTYLGIPSGTTSAVLKKLATVKLVEPFDPSHTDLDREEAKVKITSRGRLLLDWAVEQQTYVRLMAEVDPIVDWDVAEVIRQQWDSFLNGIRTQDRPAMSAAEQGIVSEYVTYVLARAKQVCPVLEHEDMSPIRELETKLRQTWITDAS